MHIPIDLQRLARALGGEVHGDKVAAPGPGHSAKDRSLTVWLSPTAPDGFSVNSHAKDDPVRCRDYVRQKAGLPAFKPAQRNGASADAIQRTLMAAVATQTQESRKGRITKTYPYTDADGTLLYEVCRHEPKAFSARRPDGNGRWIYGTPEKRVIYGWPEILSYPDGTVFLTEGEKDADRIADLGLCATTVAFGKWTEDCVKALAGRDVWILEDNDEAGRKRAREAAEALHGTAKTIRIVQLPDLADKGDVSDWLDASQHNKDKLVDICLGAPLWQPSGASEPASDPTPKLIFVNIGALADTTPPEREWGVHERFPLRQPSLLSGEGSVGKSIVHMQLSVAQVLGRDWLKMLPTPGPVIYLNAEDEEDELHRRLVSIAEHYGASVADLAKDLHLLSLAGKDAVLGYPDRNGIIKPTPLFTQLEEAACDIKPKLIGLDTAADIFAGNENDRAQVRQFIGILRGLAIRANASVLINAHPSLTGINSGSGLSGSTAWHNSVRARAYLHSVKNNDNSEIDRNLRQLDFHKNNYGPVAESIVLRWANGVFVPETVTSLETLAANKRAEDAFLAMLARYNEQGRWVGPNKGPNYAPALFAKDTATPGNVNHRALEEAMNRLFNAKKIRVETYGRRSRPSSKIVHFERETPRETDRETDA
jgi:RecA-family ATPase